MFYLHIENICIDSVLKKKYHPKAENGRMCHEGKHPKIVPTEIFYLQIFFRFHQWPTVFMWRIWLLVVA